MAGDQEEPIARRSTPVKSPSASNSYLPPEVCALILEKVFATTEDASVLFQLQHLSKGIKADLEPIKQLVRTLHITLSPDKSTSASVDNFVRTFPSVQKLKVTLVFRLSEVWMIRCNARQFLGGWLRHWQESLKAVQVSLVVLEAPEENLSTRRMRMQESKLQLISGRDTPTWLLLVPLESPKLRDDDTNRFQWAFEDLRNAVLGSKIEVVSIRNFHRVGGVIGTTLARSLWAAHNTKHVRWEGTFPTSFAICSGLDSSLERLELVAHSTAFPSTDLDGLEQELQIKVDCEGQFRHFSYTDTSGESERPLCIKMRAPWKLHSLQVLCRKSTSISPLPSSSESQPVVIFPLSPPPAPKPETPFEERVKWELRDLVIDTGLQRCLFEPHEIYRIWPDLETLLAVVSSSFMGELPAALLGLREFCPKLKRVVFKVQGEEVPKFRDWAAGVILEHADAGKPFQLTIEAEEFYELPAQSD